MVNLLVFIGVCALAASVLWRVAHRWRRAARAWRGSARLSRGYCPACAYDLAGNIPDQCPECGWTFPPNELRRLRNIAPVLRRARIRPR